MASAATSSPAAIRIVSRRAQILLQQYKQQQQQQQQQQQKQGVKAGNQCPKSSPPPPKQPAETPWPPSIRYTFYTLCVASVPFAIGQALASSPKLREYLFGDDGDMETVGVGDSGTDAAVFSAKKKILSLVRGYWGHEDYVPPIDRSPLKHATTPGYRHAWQEDNFSSALNMFGLYSQKTTDKSTATADNHNSVEENGSNSMPMSLDNEPPFHVRRDQQILSQYLSTKTNPLGVKTRLTLLPCATSISISSSSGSGGASNSDDNDDILDNIAGYDTVCTLPANITINTLRSLCKGSDAQALKRDLAEKSDVTFLSKSMSERIRTYCWREDCCWVVSFPDDDDNNTATLDGVFVDKDSPLDSYPQEHSLQKAADVLRHNTSIYSSWNYFPESSGATTTTTTAALASSLGSSSAAAKKVGPAGSTNNSATTGSSVESLQVQKLLYHISELERELKDPSSLRDRDNMYEELKLARRELRKLKPWWRRLW